MMKSPKLILLQPYIQEYEHNDMNIDIYKSHIQSQHQQSINKYQTKLSRNTDTKLKHHIHDKHYITYSNTYLHCDSYFRTNPKSSAIHKKSPTNSYIPTFHTATSTFTSLFHHSFIVMILLLFIMCCTTIKFEYTLAQTNTNCKLSIV
jgi:hypothetical protein